MTDATVVPSVITGGIGFYEQGNDGTNLQFQLKSTNIFEAGGNHQLRYGVLYEDIEYNNINQRTGPTFTLPNGTRSRTRARAADPARSRSSARSTASPARTSTTVAPDDQKYFSVFLQDTWQVGSKLTLRPGVRCERQRLVGSKNRSSATRATASPAPATAPATPFPASSRSTTTGDPAWAPRTTSRVTASPRSTRAGAGSTRRSRTTWRRARCRPTPASPAPTTSTPP